MRNITFISIGLLTAAGVGYYLWQQPQSQKNAPTRAPQEHALVESSPGAQAHASSETKTHYPVSPIYSSGAQAPDQLPGLDESDDWLDENISSLLGGKAFIELLNQDLIRRIVVTVNNATEKKLPLEFSPFKPAEGELITSHHGKLFWMSPRNSERYGAYLKPIRTLDIGRLAELYHKSYPLFQAAYKDLGSPGYFNDRLIEVIDHLLKTPENAEPIQLIQPNIVYLYANPDIESLSGSQKLLIRMGPANSQFIKTKLREFRNFVTHLDR
jgi:hypothetical protein